MDLAPIDLEKLGKADGAAGQLSVVESGGPVVSVEPLEKVDTPDRADEPGYSFDEWLRSDPVPGDRLSYA